MTEVFAIAEALRASSDRRAALATIVEARGSTYRRPGARLLIFENRETIGSISGGCLEADLIELGLQAIESGESRIVSHQPTDEDVLIGTGLGCDGQLRIAIERVSPELRKALARIEGREQLWAVIRIPREGLPEETRLLTDRELAELTAAAPQPSETRILVSEREEVFVQALARRRSLFIVGASPEARPLSQIARTLGWSVTVSDHRAAYATKERFPEVDALVVEPVESMIARLDPDPESALVVMTHNLLHDQSLLKQMANYPTAYLGLIGPSKRRERVMEPLDDDGRLPARKIFGPAGLDIAAETPEEIALSIAAEIQSVFRGGRGGSLSELPGPIHRTTRPLVKNPDVAVVVLAAGASRRLGRPKQLLRVDGVSLVERAVDVSLSLGSAGVFVVVGAEEETVRRELDGRPVTVVFNPDWEAGMSTSIRRGCAAVHAAFGEETRGVVVLLCDQPGVDGGHLSSLVATWRERGSQAVGTAYREGPGVPALLSADLFSAVETLSGDGGAKDLLRGLADEVPVVPLADTRDIDDAEDAARLDASR